MVYVGDVAAANLAASRCPSASVVSVDRCAYNIGTGIQTSVNRLAALISEASRGAPPIHHAPARPGEIRCSVLDADKAGREIGWRPRTSLAEGIRATLRWLATDAGARVNAETRPPRFGSRRVAL
jgi:UDP-glucose 4-epimerase